ncbi:hypothetical protein [Rhizobium sp. RM]|uniref:hypothetical protein n=1 Tax=Rhizobium sp. RM TaxID=2748079 RepID=UPI001FF005DF|nr:hypothetical protein [Rhizobium sp. RM]
MADEEGAGLMSSMSQFIKELVRDANEMDRLGLFEKRRMLERAINIIRDFREQIGASQSTFKRDVVKDLQTIAASIEDQSDRDVSRAFLEAAGAIRALKILMDSTPQHHDEGQDV